MTKYQNRFRKVLNYIDAHLNEALSVDCLSRSANLSKYHFHRQFSGLLGLSVATYIKQLRFKRAAYQLAFRQNTKVIDIALTSGYESSEAFSRAFKQIVGQSPTDFRNQPNWKLWHEKLQSLNHTRNFSMQQDNNAFEVSVIKFDEVNVAVLEHRGAPELLGAGIRTFIQWRKANKLPPSISRTFNLVYDDPEQTEARDYRFDLCASLTTELPENDIGMVAKTIPGGRCAVIRHTGSDETLSTVVNYLYSHWLSQSGEELRDFPLFFERVSFFPDVPEHEMLTDVYLPLK